MKKLGELQNEIPALPKLNQSDYERIFHVYQIESNGKNFYHYNILNKISIPDIINPNLIELYQVDADLPFTTIAYDVYGSIKSWWLIYILNKSVFLSNPFVIPGGTQLRIFIQDALPLILDAITQTMAFNGRHY